jgi:hypothetical protein
MNNTGDKKPADIDKTDMQDAPFVNEECGDTMWDAVLKEEDERLKKLVIQKPVESLGKSAQEGE